MSCAIYGVRAGRAGGVGGVAEEVADAEELEGLGAFRLSEKLL